MIATDYTDQVLQLHQHGRELDEHLRETILQKLDVARRTGLILAEAAASVSKPEFDDLCSRTIGEDNVRGYISFAAAHPEPVEDTVKAFNALKSALYLTGLIQKPLPKIRLNGQNGNCDLPPLRQTPAYLPFNLETNGVLPDHVAIALERAVELLEREHYWKWDKAKLDAVIAILEPVLCVCGAQSHNGNGSNGSNENNGTEMDLPRMRERV